MSRVNENLIWNEGEPHAIVRPTALILKGQVSRGSDGLWGILVNPGGEGRSLAARVCELDSDEGIVAMSEIDDALQRLHLRVRPEPLNTEGGSAKRTTSAREEWTHRVLRGDTTFRNDSSCLHRDGTGTAGDKTLYDA